MHPHRIPPSISAKQTLTPQKAKLYEHYQMKAKSQTSLKHNQHANSQTSSVCEKRREGRTAHAF
eukprot:472183-Amphidinium_carterae.1